MEKKHLFEECYMLIFTNCTSDTFERMLEDKTFIQAVDRNSWKIGTKVEGTASERIVLYRCQLIGQRNHIS